MYEKLNPIEINIRDSEILGKLSRYGSRRYKYHFIIDSLLISSSVVQDTNVIFLISNGLNDARDSLINGKLCQSLTVINISEIICWTKIKGESKWINIIINDPENPQLAKHFAFAFETVNLSGFFSLAYLTTKPNLLSFIQTKKRHQH